MHVHLQVAVSTGIITTIAGKGSAGGSGDGGPATSAYLYGPQGVYVDASGNVYIADTFNCKIRKVCVCGTNIAATATYANTLMCACAWSTV